ncbi:MAG TPA: hypothetical protein GXZ59_08545, partial [Clostridiaceae bacterium]|nr:hypothetical protein [Clostridiaceae bacterium]
VAFCRGICSQAQLSRLENGGILKDNEVYRKFLDKLNLPFDRVGLVDNSLFEQAMDDILVYQNSDDLIINARRYEALIEDFQRKFRNNIVYTHYTYVLEFIVYVLEDELDEARTLLEYILGTMDILPPKYLVLALHYLGIYYAKSHQYNDAYKYYTLALENMLNEGIKNEIIHVDLAVCSIHLRQHLYAVASLNKAFATFSQTTKHWITAKIHVYYSIIYLVKGYYDESRKHLEEANHQLNLSKHSNLEVRGMMLCTSVALSHMKNEPDMAQATLVRAIEVYPNETTALLQSIIEGLPYAGESTIYRALSNYFNGGHKEKVFENHRHAFIQRLPIIVKHIVVMDYYHYLKDKNKYKKALQLIEHYRLHEYE